MAEEKKKSSTVLKMGREAVAQLAELTGRKVEGVSGVHHNDDGWVVNAEVLELRRIPETNDVLAIYEVTLDDDGSLTGYRRVRRYTRAQTEEF
ncbi:MAG: gas vesicle protein [Nocardioides sp.]